jgi:lipopolysaccharide assembly outer membrane protein LptD (OstA)
MVYDAGKSVTGRNMWLYLEDIPVGWLPWFYYPLNTNYGLRMLPGYTGRWGTFLLTKYVYDIYDETG